MPETKKPKAAVSTPDTPLLQEDWDEARRTRPDEFLPSPCVLNTNAAKEAEDSHRQTPPVSKNRPEPEGQSAAEEKDAFRAHAPQIENAPVQPKPSDRAGSSQGNPGSSQDRRSDNEVVRGEGLNAPREEAKRHEGK